MKVTKVDVLHVDGGWRPWTYVKIQTDEGLTGYGECSDNRLAYSIAGCVRDLEHLVLGRDPHHVEMITHDLYRAARHAPGGVVQKAIAGIDLALWDIKGKALGVPVYTLFGGPTRDKVRVYWSHCGTTRARHAELVGKPPLRTMEDIARLGREVVERGFTALKTNIIFPGDPATVWMPGFGGPPGTSDRTVEPWLLRHIQTLIATFRQAVGPDVDINLDLNFNFTPESCIRIAKALEPYNLLWLEIDNYNPEALLQIKMSTSTRITSGENLYGIRGYRRYFELQCVDHIMIDVPWNGFGESRKIATMAEAYDINVSPHNYYSHLSSFISAQLCATLTNVRIMEIDIDDVPWKDELCEPPLMEKGYMKIPTKPGWGTEFNERVAAKHPWNK